MHPDNIYYYYTYYVNLSLHIISDLRCVLIQRNFRSKNEKTYIGEIPTHLLRDELTTGIFLLCVTKQIT